MANSPLSRFRVQESVGRSAADLSAPRNFHQSAGMLIPVMARAMVAGTDGYIDRKSFTRTKTPLFPAFQQVTQCVDVFVVPLRYLFTPWKDWKLNINDINSSNFLGGEASADLSLMTSVPRMDFGSLLYQKIYNVGLVKSSGNSKGATEYVNNFNRLCDALDYGQSTIFSNSACQQSLFMLAAYQKVYYDFYRNTAYESNNPYAYNLDWLWNYNSGLLDRNATEGASKSWSALLGLTQLHYVNYRNDYFHNIYPSLNTVVSQPTGSTWELPSSVVGLSQVLGSSISTNEQNIPRFIQGGQVVTGQSIRSGSSTVNSSFGPNVQQIRAAFALDKLMRVSAYTPKHVKEQFKARFDVDLPESVGMESVRVGSWQNDITFGEVTSVANTDTGQGTGDPLGAVGGKGVGSASDSRIHFHCKEDSIVLAIQYFMPLAMYDSTSIGAWNVKLTREDYFQPEFQNLGLRPLYRKELYYTGDPDVDNLIIGYTVPNQYYKVPIAKNYGIFNSTYFQLTDTGDLQVVSESTSALTAYTVHTSNVLRYSADSDGVSASYFKVFPADIDGLFEQAYDGYYDTDQFFGQVRFGIQITHNMTVHGMPSI